MNDFFKSSHTQKSAQSDSGISVMLIDSAMKLQSSPFFFVSLLSCYAITHTILQRGRKKPARSPSARQNFGSRWGILPPFSLRLCQRIVGDVCDFFSRVTFHVVRLFSLLTGQYGMYAMVVKPRA